MKTIILIPLILNYFLVSGQEWAPIGAEWYYDVTYAFSGNIDYKRIYCDSSVNINGIGCRRINIDFRGCNNHFSQKLYTYESNDTIFFYNTDINAFQILYNFSASQGDNWQIIIKDDYQITDTVKINVDSTELIVINGQLLKKLYVTYNYRFYFETSVETHHKNSIVIEKIGDMDFIINILDKYSGACDEDYIKSLRCYYDPGFGLYSTGLRDSCNYEYDYTSVYSNLKTEVLKVYPNPILDVLTIDIDNGQLIYYELINQIGIIIKKGFERQIDLSSLQNGIYFLKVKSDGYDCQTIKLVKH